MAIQVVNMDDFNKEVMQEKDKLVLVDFWAVWCAPCQYLNPVIAELAEEFKDKLKVVKVNVDEASDIASTYGIMSIPTVMFFKEGKQVKTMIGAQPLDVFKNVVKDLLDESAE